MFKDRPEIIKLAREFVNICKNNNIWYTVDNGSLLGAVRHGGMIPWDDDFDVMMTHESYRKLKVKFPERVIDTDMNGYPLLIPKFMKNKNDFLSSAVFVDIFLLIPTNKRKVKSYRSFKNKFKFAMQTIHSDWKAYNFGSKIFKFFTFPFKKIPKKITIDSAVDSLMLTDEKVEGFFTVDNPIDSFKTNWQHKISMSTEEMFFEDFVVNVPVEYKDILTNKYGDDYMVPNKKARSIEHVNAISIVKVKRK